MNRILVIDDDKELCELLADYLGPEGFSIEASKKVPGELDIRLLSSVYVKTGR